jgi:hypothetical protein
MMIREDEIALSPSTSAGLRIPPTHRARSLQCAHIRKVVRCQLTTFQSPSPNLPNWKGNTPLFVDKPENTMIRKSNIVVIVAVAALVLASPALAQSIPGYGPQGSAVPIGQRSKTHHKSATSAESLRGLHDSFAAPNGAFGFQSDGTPLNGASMGNMGH